MDGGIIEGMLIGAAVGGGTSALTGGDPLKGALMGGLTGGIGSGVMGGAAGGGAGGATSSATAPLTSAGVATSGAATSGLAGSGIAGLPAAATAVPNAATSSLSDMISNAAQMSIPTAAPVAPTAASAISQMPSLAPASVPGIMGQGAQAAMQAAPAAPTSLIGDLKDWWGGLTTKEKLMYGVGGSLAGSMLMESMRARQNMPGEEKYKGPLSRFKYDPDYYTPSLPYADGGITSLGGGNIAVGGDPRRNTSPLEQSSVPVNVMASGGISSLGSYSDGGRLLKGPGDGMSDNIPATIGRKQPARLADSEFVVPADVVSHLGNGSTDAGARQLYAMMDRVRKARTGTTKQGRQIKPEKYLPA